MKVSTPFAAVMLAAAIGGCALSAPDDSPLTSEMGDDLEVPETSCVWVTTDCFQWAGGPSEQNRLCTQSCGAPSVCHFYTVVIDYTCTFGSGDNGDCLTAFHSAYPCSRVGAYTCGLWYEQRGRCDILTGEP